MHRVRGERNDASLHFQIPSEITTTSARLLVRFKTDARNSKKGFKIFWSEQRKAEKCEFFISGTAGTITSPGYPNRYAPDTDCYWHLSAPERQKIRLDFKDVETMDCQRDFTGKGRTSQN